MTWLKRWFWPLLVVGLFLVAMFVRGRARDAALAKAAAIRAEAARRARNRAARRTANRDRAAVEASRNSAQERESASETDFGRVTRQVESPPAAAPRTPTPDGRAAAERRAAILRRNRR